MHRLPYDPPENGKIFYLLSDSEMDSFNYYKEHGSIHGLDVSLKVAITEFGNVLVVQVKALSSLVKKTFSKITSKFGTTNNHHNPQLSETEESTKPTSKTELARKQGIPETLIKEFITNKSHNESIGGVNFGMYREQKRCVNKPITPKLSQNKQKKPLSLLDKFLFFLRNLI